MSTDPDDIGPCYDGCACDHCWKGWTTVSVQRRVQNRIEHIIFNDVEVEHISQEMAKDKVKNALDFLRNTMRDALMEACSYADAYISRAAAAGPLYPPQEYIEAVNKDVERIRELRKVGKPDG